MRIARPDRPPRLSRALAAALSALALIASGCASGDDHAPREGDADIDIGGKLPPGSCGTETGCACEHVGETIACRAYRRSGTYLACSEGLRVCGPDGRWQECIGDRVAD